MPTRSPSLTQPCWRPAVGQRVHIEGVGSGTVTRNPDGLFVTEVHWDGWAAPCLHPSAILISAQVAGVPA